MKMTTKLKKLLVTIAALLVFSFSGYSLQQWNEINSTVTEVVTFVEDASEKVDLVKDLFDSGRDLLREAQIKEAETIK